MNHDNFDDHTTAIDDKNQPSRSKEKLRNVIVVAIRQYTHMRAVVFDHYFDASA